MERVLLLVVLALAAVAVAQLLQRRRPDPPSAPSYRAPRQLDRDDFITPDRRVLVVVFGSETCETCPQVWSDVEPLGDDHLAVQYVTVQRDHTLHQRYRIDGVPTTVVADEQGVVVQTFFGPVPVNDLAAAIEAAAGSNS